MIINLKKYQQNILLKFYFNLKSLIIDLFSSSKTKTLVNDSKYLDSYFVHKYPALKKDISGHLLCVSCNLCVEVCPTKALDLKKSGMLNIPQTLTSGEVPKNFYLDVKKCIKCHLCADVCFVKAIDLNRDYSDSKVDLVVGEIQKGSEKS